ncbi:hypothetical protein O9X98_15450 [Agrobacterium salinitolerans]|nr:hypothetical protein [Agrobacterium salinitolerans]
MQQAEQTYEDLTAIAAMELFQRLRDHPHLSNERLSRDTRRKAAATELRLAAERNEVKESDVLLVLATGMNPLMPESEVRERLGL